MLTEQRQEEILRLLNQKGSVTLQELKEYFHASESTIRRDLNALDKRGALTKVFGGAVRPEGRVMLRTRDLVSGTLPGREKQNRQICGFSCGAGRFRLSGRRHYYRSYDPLSYRALCGFCHKRRIPCPSSGGEWISGDPHRRRSKGGYRGYRGKRSLCKSEKI